MLELWLESHIRRKLGGYKVLINTIDRALPTRLAGSHRVAIVGAGLGGIASAALLGERGFQVSLFERNSYLGGKVGSWPVEFSDGSRTQIDHGFHAFFRHYYNLRAFLEKIGATGHLKTIDDYLILTRDGRSFGFRDIAAPPLLNILSLGRNGFYRFSEVLFQPAAWRMREFLKYDEARTFARFDSISFAEFADRSRLPATLRLVFSTFARAFFAPGAKLSMAALIKSFHFFYLSHGHALFYDYFTTNYADALIEPAREHLLQHRVSIKLDCPLAETARSGNKFAVAGEIFDSLILAADVNGTREICRNSPWVGALSPLTAQKVTALEASDGYAVYRLWLDRRDRRKLPAFIITEKRELLDAVTFYHAFDGESARWAQASGGGVYELHCYALPHAAGEETELKAAFMAEFLAYFPELRGARIVRDYLQVKRDFPAFHTGLNQQRPGVTTGVPGFYLAGDWVKIPSPAMLMEAAFTSGLLAANEILTQLGLQQEPVYSVPLRGIFA